MKQDLNISVFKPVRRCFLFQLCVCVCVCMCVGCCLPFFGEGGGPSISFLLSAPNFAVFEWATGEQWQRNRNPSIY